MLGIWTSKNGLSWVIACLSITICGCSRAIPDPRSLSPTQPPAPRKLTTLMPATGHVYSAVDAPPAAPLGEALVRPQGPRQVTALDLAVGSGAATTLHQGFVRAFAAEDDRRLCRQQRCSDREAIEHVKISRADAALIRGRLCSRDLQAGLRETQLGVELFGLFVRPSSDVRSLGPDQIRRIFTGQVTDWRELGFAAGAITPIVSAGRGARERAATVMLPGDRFAKTCSQVTGQAQLVERMLEQPGAIALVRVPRGAPTPRLQAVRINGVAPSAASFGDGSYPYGVPLQLVSMGVPAGAAAELVAFARSEAGRATTCRYLTTAR